MILYILYVSSVLSLVQSHDCIQNKHLGKFSGQFNLLGLVPTKTRSFGLIVFEAIKFAVKEVNRDIFDNTAILGYELRDTCSNYGLAFMTEATVDVILQDDPEKQGFAFNDGICSCQNPDEQTFKYLGLVGPSYSSHALLVNQILSSSKIPSISFSATSTALRAYPNFFRTIAADDVFAKAVLDLVQHFKWSYVSMIGSSDSYGFYGKQALVALFSSNQICVDVDELFTIPYELTDLYRIVRKLKQSQIEKGSSVVILFALEFVVYDILKIAEQLTLYGVTWILSDSADLSHSLDKFHPKVINGLFTYVHVGDGYTAFEEHMMNMSQQWNDNILLSMFLKKNNITSFEHYANVISSSISFSGFIRNAVYAYGYALNNYLTSVCIYQSFLNCSMNHKFNETLFLNKYLGNVLFAGLHNESVSFNEFGDVNTAFFRLQNVQYKHRELVIRTVGTWDSNNGLWVTEEIAWATGTSSIPLSRCSETCTPGYYPVLNIGKRCCWICVSCEVGHIKPTHGNSLCTLCHEKITNKNQTECIEFEWIGFSNTYKYIVYSLSSLGVLCSICVIVSLFKFRDTPVIKACNFKLSMLQVCAQLFLFMTITFLMVDGDITLYISLFFVDGLLCIFILSIMLVKSEQLLRIFKSQVKPTSQDVMKTNAIGVAILICTGVIELLMIGSLLLFTNGNEKVIYYVQDSTKEKSCNLSVHIQVQILYIVILALACGVEAFRCRKLPSKYNEAHAIVYAVFFMLLLLTLCIPLRLSAPNGMMKSFVLYTITYSSNMVILCIMYGYKMWITWCRPDLNVAKIFQMSIFTTVLENVDKQLKSKRNRTEISC